MSTFARDIASATCAGEAERLRMAFSTAAGHPDLNGLSADGQAVYSLLAMPDADQAEADLNVLPPAMQERLSALTPNDYLPDIHAPLIVVLHDRVDR